MKKTAKKDLVTEILKAQGKTYAQWIEEKEDEVIEEVIQLVKKNKSKASEKKAEVKTIDQEVEMNKEN